MLTLTNTHTHREAHAFKYKYNECQRKKIKRSFTNTHTRTYQHAQAPQLKRSLSPFTTSRITKGTGGLPSIYILNLSVIPTFPRFPSFSTSSALNTNEVVFSITIITTSTCCAWSQDGTEFRRLLDWRLVANALISQPVVSHHHVLTQVGLTRAFLLHSMQHYAVRPRDAVPGVAGAQLPKVIVRDPQIVQNCPSLTLLL